MKRIFIIVQLLIMNPFMVNAMGMPGGMPGGMPMDMGQMQDFEAQLMREIDQYVSNLSPEEQAEFQRQVEEETKKIESMNPDELNSYIQESFAMPEQPPANLAPLTEKKAEKKEQAEQVVPTATETTKQKNTIVLINELIKLIENYLRKLTATQELRTKLPKWVRQGRISGWKQDETFNDFKNNIESFNQQLYKIKKQDEKTKKYTFLTDIIENETILNNLTKLKDSLAYWDPQITLKTLEFQTLDEKSKKAVIQATNTILEGLNTLALPKALDDIIVKYDPEAKRLREEAEKQQKKVIEDSRKTSTPTAAKVVGTDTTGNQQYQPGGYDADFGGYDFGSYGAYSPYDDYGSYGGYGDSPYGNNRKAGSLSDKSDGSFDGGSYGGGARGTGSRSKGRFDLSDAKGTDAKGKKKKKDKDLDPQQQQKTALSPLAEGRIATFNTDMTKAVDTLDDANIKFSDMKTTVLSKVKDSNQKEIGNTAFDNTEKINTAISALESAHNTLARLDKGASNAQRTAYGKKIDDATAGYATKFNELYKNIIELQRSVQNGTMPAENQYVYFNKTSEDKVQDQFKTELANKTTNLGKVTQLMKNINNGINALKKGKPVPSQAMQARKKPKASA